MSRTALRARAAWRTSDLPRGTLQMTTFRNEPKIAPRIPAMTHAVTSVIRATPNSRRAPPCSGSVARSTSAPNRESHGRRHRVSTTTLVGLPRWYHGTQVQASSVSVLEDLRRRRTCPSRHIASTCWPCIRRSHEQLLNVTNPPSAPADVRQYVVPSSLTVICWVPWQPSVVRGLVVVPLVVPLQLRSARWSGSCLHGYAIIWSSVISVPVTSAQRPNS